MGFEVGNNVNKKISLEQLTNGLDAVKDKKKIDRITQIFNKYNTNVEGYSENVLDLDEQISIMSDYHKADKNNDSNVSRRDIRKAGFAGEYKAYRDFMEAYQKAIGEEKYNNFELTIKDGTVDGQAYSDIKATKNTTVDGNNISIQHQYISANDKTQKARMTVVTDAGKVSYSPKGQLLQQTIGDTTYRYHQYDSGAKGAVPGVIVVSEADGASQTVKLQQDGTYLDENDNSHYRLNRQMQLDEFQLDAKNRITAEIFGDNQLEYTYPENTATPATITVTDNQDQQKIYNHEKDLIYSSQNGDNKEYFSFNQATRTFAASEAPKPDKQDRQAGEPKIRYTEGWRGQRQKLSDDVIAQFNEMSTASEVLAKLIDKPEYMSGGKPIKFNDSLLSDLIRNNPSMFDKEGNIYSNANWKKLDFPTNLRNYVLTE